MKHIWLWLPLGLFVLFFAVVANGLINPADRVIMSTMIGKPAPQFSLPSAVDGLPGVGVANLRDGKPKLVNIFASWCIPCASEAPMLEQLAKQGIEIHGIAIRDRRQDLDRFLARYGNPYARIGADNDAKAQISFGSAGVPETFVVDGKGIIRYQIAGDINPSNVGDLLTALKAAK
ncbi:MAG: DsbE family thiol:disulfide interchange protein [Pseudomonadota bacterium]